MPDSRPTVTFTMLTPAAARRRARRRQLARIAYGAIIVVAIVAPSPLHLIAEASATAMTFL